MVGTPRGWGLPTVRIMGRRRQKLAGLAEVAELLGGVSRQRAAEIVARKTFPEPLDTLAAGRVWDEAEVVAWIRQYRPHQQPDE